MHRIKNIALGLLFSSIGFNALSQNFGLKAGLTVSKFHYIDTTGFQYNNFRANYGFHFGPNFEFPMGKVFSFETAALISNVGAVYDNRYFDFDFWQFKGVEIKQHSVYNLYYVDVPLQIKTNFSSKNSRFYIGLGGFISIGFAGNINSTITTTYWDEDPIETELRDEIFWGNDRSMGDVLTRFNYGLSGSIGLEVKAIFVEASYSHGLANVSSDKNESLVYRSLNVSLGYRFKPQKN